MGDVLFLAKNYPNVALNLCWVFIIDPLYAQEMIQRAIVTLPQSKIHAFGGDYEDIPEFAAGHLRLAREVLCAALCERVESGWLDEDAALDIARAYLFDNPNAFFGLGLEA
jgi:hypothetical protein